MDLEALYRMHVNQTYFVTRAKATMKYEVVDINYNINDLVGIIGDRTVHLAGYVSEKKYPEDLRMVEFYDAEKEEVIAFITNNFELGPLVIATSTATGGRSRRSFMTSISLCKVDIKATLIFNKLSMLLLVSTLHNNIND